MARADSKEETLAIPQRIRDEVDARDTLHCRLCGRYDDRRALHHILYGGDTIGMGGRRKHVAAEIITVGWVPGHECHQLIHSNKTLWQPLALLVVSRPGMTMLQLYRQQRRRRVAP